MKTKFGIIFFAFFHGYVAEIIKNTAIKKSHSHHVPTIPEIKLLEKEIWKATSSGDLSRALRLENRLEKNVLRAALEALAQKNKDPIKSKRDISELGVLVRRDKRTVQMLSSFVSLGTKPILGLLFGQNKIGENGSYNRTLIRRTRQGNYNSNKLPQFEDLDDVELTNDIIPQSTTDIGVATTISSLNDSVTSDANSESITTPTTVSTTFSRQEEEDEDEGGGGLGGLITSFLGSLSTPEGGVDLDAVTGLLGGISTQNDDGTFDFTGLQDTVGSLFGGSEEGGSNVGLFLGGLLGAVIRGSAGDQGAKGAGRLIGNIFSAILPGLSAFPTPEEDGEPAKPQEGLNSGGFIGGLIKSLLANFGGTSNSNSSGGGDKMGGNKTSILQLKFQIFKSIFSIITKVLGASSTSKQQH